MTRSTSSSLIQCELSPRCWPPSVASSNARSSSRSMTPLLCGAQYDVCASVCPLPYPSVSAALKRSISTALRCNDSSSCTSASLSHSTGTNAPLSVADVLHLRFGRHWEAGCVRKAMPFVLTSVGLVDGAT